MYHVYLLILSFNIPTVELNILAILHLLICMLVGSSSSNRINSSTFVEKGEDSLTHTVVPSKALLSQVVMQFRDRGFT